jgi:hypothetical protein
MAMQRRLRLRKDRSFHVRSYAPVEAGGGVVFDPSLRRAGDLVAESARRSEA